jgi:hypothetical protein
MNSASTIPLHPDEIHPCSLDIFSAGKKTWPATSGILESNESAIRRPAKIVSKIHEQHHTINKRREEARKITLANTPYIRAQPIENGPPDNRDMAASPIVQASIKASIRRKENWCDRAML